jgi:SSS family solute:Na+ symporter
VIIVAIIYIPAKLGGWGAIFGAAEAKFDKTRPPPTASCSTAPTSGST